MLRLTQDALNRLEHGQGNLKEKWADYRLILNRGNDSEKWKLAQIVAQKQIPLPSGKIRTKVSFLGLSPRPSLDEEFSWLLLKNMEMTFGEYPNSNYIVLDSSLKFNKEGLPVPQEAKVLEDYNRIYQAVPRPS